VIAQGLQIGINPGVIHNAVRRSFEEWRQHVERGVDGALSSNGGSPAD
jgi:hypothetical protein